jgi:ABC-2 type transport system permease protein
MSLAVLVQTLKDKARGTGLAVLLILVFVTYMVIMFPEMSKMAGLEELMSSPTIQALLGKTANFTTFDGLMSTEAFTLLGLIICGYIGFVAASFLAGEIEMKTIDLLLAQPVTRVRLVVMRYGVLVPIAVTLMLAMLASIYLGTQYMNIAASYDWFAYALVCLGLFTLSFGAISLFVSAILSDGRAAAIVSLGILFIMYFMETVGQSVEKLSIVRSLSLFHYAQYSDMLIYHDLSPGNMAVLATVAIVFLGLAAFAFRHRDINVA